MPANAATLQISIEVDDNGSIKIRQVGKEADTATGKIDSGFKKSGRTIEDFNKKLGSINWRAIAAAAVAAFTAITYSLYKTLQAASNLQETTSKFETVFKGQTQQAYQWAKTLQDSYAMSRREALQYMSSLQDLLKPMGMAETTAAKLSFEITKLAADLGSFNNLPTAQVIADIQSALVGNYETMKKYGVVLNAANVEQRAMTISTALSAEKLTAAEKAMAAFQLIVKGSTDAMGDMERTQDSYANQLKKFKANIEDTSATIGNLLIPKATEIIKQLNEWTKINEKLIEQKVDKYIASIMWAAEGIWSILKNDPAIIEWGLVGLIFWGKKGALIGAVAGHIASWTEYISKAYGLYSAGAVTLEQLDKALSNFPYDIEPLKKLVEDFDKAFDKVVIKAEAAGKKVQAALMPTITQSEAEKYAGFLDYITQESLTWQTLDIEDRQHEILESGKEVYQELTETAKESHNKIDDSYRIMLESMQGRTSDFIYDLFSRAIDSAAEAFDRIKSYFLRMLADMAAKAITEPIIVPVVQSIVGGATSAFGSVLGSAGSSLMGGGNSSGLSGIAGMFGGGSSMLQSLIYSPAFLGEELIGPASASGLLSFMGPSSAAAAGIASFASVALPIAAIALPFILSSLFKKKKLTHGSVAPTTGVISGGELDIEKFTGAHGRDIDDKVAEALNEALGDIEKVFNTQIESLVSMFPKSFKEQLEGISMKFGATYPAAPDAGWILDTENMEKSIAELSDYMQEQFWDAITDAIQAQVFDVVDKVKGYSSYKYLGSDYTDAITKLTTEGRAGYDTEAEWIQAIKDFMTATGAAEEAWKSINQTIDDTLNPLTEYELQLRNTNNQFDAWIETLKKLGFTEEAIAEIEGKRGQVLDKLAQAEEKRLADEQAEAARRELANSVRMSTARIGELAREIDAISAAAESAIAPFASISGNAAAYLTAQARRDWGISDYQYRYQELERMSGALDPASATYRDESLKIMNEQFDVLQSIEQLNAEQVQAAESLAREIETLISSFSTTIDRITGGDLAPAKSAGFYGQKYVSLLTSARGGDRAAAEEFNQFVSEYLEFMGAFGGNYSQLTSAVLKDLTGLKGYYGDQKDLATNEMLLETTISTNDLLRALIYKADEQIAVIRQQAAAEISSRQSAIDVQRQSQLSSYQSIIGQFYGTLGFSPGSGDVSYWAEQLANGRSTYDVIKGILHGGLPTNDMLDYFSGYGLQHGGTAYAGMPYWVGEAGPEPFIPSQSGTVISNNTIRQAFDPAAIGNAVARALAPMVAAGARSGGVKIYLNNREIACAFAQEIPRNSDLQYAISRVR